ncbi:MAG: hypothetical protein LBI79_06220 [Nitrososphaerota archaeon]|jgi:hypothetical protein|nr:hypothetical protein [Nitrososphaerota archaeon]
MKIEKKLFALSILAITIGVATVVPAAVFMNAKAQTYQTYDDPWFSIEDLEAYFAIDPADEGYWLTEMFGFQITLNDNALSQQSEGRMEYFEFALYTDDIQLANSTYCISMANPYNENPAKMQSLYWENWGNSSTSGIPCNSSIHITDLNELTYPRGFGYSYIVNGEKYGNVLEAQTIYLDVRKVCYVTFDGDNAVITLANNQDIQHMELIKNGNSYTFGPRDNSDIDTFRQTHLAGT